MVLIPNSLVQAYERYRLIAVMLGRLRMSIKDCISAYLKISERIFQPKRDAFNKAGQVRDFLQANGKFDHRNLEAAIKEIITKQCEKSEDELLKDPDPRCKVYVLRRARSVTLH